MSDLVNREELLEKLEEYIEYDTFDQYKEEPLINLSFEQLEDIICSQPTVEAKPVANGEWKSELGLFFPVYRCSECNYASALGKTNFCPYCGADMRKKVE